MTIIKLLGGLLIVLGLLIANFKDHGVVIENIATEAISRIPLVLELEFGL